MGLEINVKAGDRATWIDWTDERTDRWMHICEWEEGEIGEAGSKGGGREFVLVMPSDANYPPRALLRIRVWAQETASRLSVQLQLIFTIAIIFRIRCTYKCDLLTISSRLPNSAERGRQ